MRFARLVLSTLLLAGAAPAAAHDTTIGGSRWCIGKDWIVGIIDLDRSLLTRIPGVDGDGPDLDSRTEAQLAELARGVLQPYVDRKLAVAIGGAVRSARVQRVVPAGSVWQIWLLVDGFTLERPANAVTIEYRLLLDETNGAHVNLAYIYRSEGGPEDAQRAFDFAQPTWQTAFERGARRWEGNIPGPAREEIARRSTPPPSPSGTARGVRRVRTAGVGASGASEAIPTTPGRRAETASVEPAPLPIQQAPPPPGGAEAPATGERRAWWAQIGRFLLLGVEHILTGYDHIAFLLALIVVAPSLREVLPIITAFTAAHSITLLLAALQVARLDARIVEPAIALSICWVAVENLLRKKAAHRWAVTFCFGLVHGFGFASVLRELVVGSSDLVVSVVSFNAGVELGQLAIFAVMLPLLRVAGALIGTRRVALGTSVAIGLLGCAWALERGLDVKLLPTF
jgi:hydrogenase/urease accessory protein HupE